MMEEIKKEIMDAVKEELGAEIKDMARNLVDDFS